MFFVLWGMFIPFFYLPTYGQAHGMSESAANNLLAYLNAGSLVARVVTGFIADRFGRLVVDDKRETPITHPFSMLKLSQIQRHVRLRSRLRYPSLRSIRHHIHRCNHRLRCPLRHFLRWSNLAPIRLYRSNHPRPQNHRCQDWYHDGYLFVWVRTPILYPLPTIHSSKRRNQTNILLLMIRGLTGSPIGGALITANHGGFTGMIAFSAVILTAGGFLVLLARFIAAPKLRVF